MGIKRPQRRILRPEEVVRARPTALIAAAPDTGSNRKVQYRHKSGVRTKPTEPGRRNLNWFTVARAEAMDEIQKQCELLLSDDLETHTDAYRWLTQCKPFVCVLHRLQQYDMTLFEVADLLCRGSRRSLADAALWMLEQEVQMSRG